MRVIKLEDKVFKALTQNGTPDGDVRINEFHEMPDGSFETNIPANTGGKYIRTTLTAKLVAEMLEDGRAVLLENNDDQSR